METTPALRILTCDMHSDCSGTVTHIDCKGWVYCATHGPYRRQSGIRCRKLKPAEMKKLQNGQQIRYSR